MAEIERFKNRAQAGKLLAERLGSYAHRNNVLVLALPRGGVPVAYEVALALGAELDILLVRKIGMPGHEEYALGAVGSGGVQVLQPGVPGLMGVTQEQVDAIAEWARMTYGFMGRSPDYKAAFLGTLGANSDFYDPYQENAKRWYKQAQERCLFFNHAIINPPVDRHRDPDALHAAREQHQGQDKGLGSATGTDGSRSSSQTRRARSCTSARPRRSRSR